MNRRVSSPHVRLLVGLNVALLAACSANTESPPPPDVSSIDGAVDSVPVEAGGGAGSLEGGSGSVPTGQDASSGAVDATTRAEASASVSGDEAGASTSGSEAAAPRPRDAGADAAAEGGGASVTPDAGVPSGCSLPSTVSFQRDVQPFLMTSCNGTGCHVIDAASTMASGGFDHAYDWITAGAHASSCPETPTPLRFQVVIAVINKANPASCSKSDKMPPPTATGGSWPALTACQVATLQAWLNEPLVTQMHRADDSSPKTPYPMPPFN